MTPDVYIEAKRIITDYKLHCGSPVQLDALEDMFTVRFVDMAQHEAYGAVLTPPNGWPARPGNHARILVDYNLGDSESRLTIAHEVGHALCHHHGNLSSLSLGLEDKHERQAWEVAALLLIPLQVVHEEREISRIASVCHVPEWLVEIWQSING